MDNVHGHGTIIVRTEIVFNIFSNDVMKNEKEWKKIMSENLIRFPVSINWTKFV